MKKLLGIVVLGLLLSGNAYAEKIILNCKGEILGTKYDDYYIVDTSKKTLKISFGETVNVRINDKEILMADLNTNKSSKGYNLKWMKFDRYKGIFLSFNVYINDKEFKILQEKIASSDASHSWSWIELAAIRAGTEYSHKDNLIYNGMCEKSDKKF